MTMIILFMLVVLYLVAPSLSGQRDMIPWDNLYGLPPWQEPGQHITPHNMLISDMVLLSMPWQQFACQARKQHEAPSWNPYILCGKPNYSGLLLGFRYPLNRIWQFVPPARAAVWLFAFHIFTAAILTYLLARRLGMCVTAAGLAGLTYSLGAPVLVNMTFPSMWGGLAWMPGCLLAIKGLADTPSGHGLKRLGWILFGLIMYTLVTLSGHPELTFHAFFFSGCFAAYLCIRALLQKQKQVVFIVAASFILFALTGFAIVLPDIPSFQSNFRSDSIEYETVRSYALPPYQTALFLAPNLYGSPVQHRYLDPYSMKMVKPEHYREVDQEAPPIDFGKKNYVEGSIYVGIIPLVMLLVAGMAYKDKLFFWLYLLAALLISFGTPLYAFFYYCIPFAQQLRTPFRWMIPATFCIGILAGFGLDAWMKSATKRNRIQRAGFFLLALALLAFGFVCAGRIADNAFLRLATSMYQNITRCRDVLAHPSELLRFEMGQILLSALWIGLAGMACLGAAYFKSVRKGAALLLGIATITLVTWAKPFFTHAPAELGSQIPQSIQYLQNQKGLFRVASFGPDTRILPPNSCMLYGLSDIRGYDSILPKPYVEFFDQIETQQISLLYNIVGVVQQRTTLNSSWLDFLNLKYVLTREVLTRPDWTLCYENGLNIYRNTEVYPRYYLAKERPRVFEEGPPPPIPGALCEIISYGLNRIILDVHTQESAWLISSEADYGLWKATIDGVAVVSEPYLGIFRCIHIDAGKHRVEWTYNAAVNEDA